VRAGEATTWIALLRGINVGTAKPVSMAALRTALEHAGFEDVATILRSGNVVLRGQGSAVSVAAGVERAIETDLGVRSAVVVRTPDELQAAIDANPFSDKADDGSRLHVMFLGEPLTAGERSAIRKADFGDDRVEVAEREVYAWYANGMSGSDTATRLAKLVKARSTDRNWNTVMRLRALVDG
jgi:uncharacterized protein (DUF1697 family)